MYYLSLVLFPTVPLSALVPSSGQSLTLACLHWLPLGFFSSMELFLWCYCLESRYLMERSRDKREREGEQKKSVCTVLFKSTNCLKDDLLKAHYITLWPGWCRNCCLRGKDIERLRVTWAVQGHVAWKHPKSVLVCVCEGSSRILSTCSCQHLYSGTIIRSPCPRLLEIPHSLKGFLGGSDYKKRRNPKALLWW